MIRERQKAEGRRQKAEGRKGRRQKVKIPHLPIPPSPHLPISPSLLTGYSPPS
ncbi:hypothetical protein [[Phormidium ambiguum] IAM M-71]|uniref:hypothetical protein n=1 Tax=[Phormidium ambiguum] IAM M-71 TaxID=454136 RepID=UPI0015BC91E3|nr:hypothetical protein [Phormidium ambiguum]